MRYIRQQKFITTVSDEDIIDIKSIKSLLDVLCTGNVIVSIVYMEKIRDVAVSYDARIQKVYDTSVDIKALRGTGSLIMRGILFTDIISIKLVADTDNIIISDNKTNRFDLLDIETEKNIEDSK